MILSKNSQNLKTLAFCPKYFFGGGGPVQRFRQTLETKHNPERLKELRGHQQAELHMTEYAKDFYYVHSKRRYPYALYSLMNKLPLSASKFIGSLTQDQSVQINNDQLQLPKIAENSIPVYQSLSSFGTTLKRYNVMVCLFPLGLAAFSGMPLVNLVTFSVGYYVLFHQSYNKATANFVTRLELLPETEELIYQKVSRIGTIKTSRVRLNDIEVYDGSEGLVFERSMRSFVSKHMAFRVRSTGEVLMFDREGAWHEEGLYHELMP